MDKVSIVILNWNGYDNTIECLESVFRNDYPNYRVIVCDNGSTDGSVERIKAWADGRYEPPEGHGGSLRSLVSPGVTKPIRYLECTREDAEWHVPRDSETALIVVRILTNLGYAGGNNVGLRLALADSDSGYVWLLNNDTIVRADALSRMVQRMREKPDAGLCGSTLLYYDEPNRIQASGGFRYNKWLAVSRQIDHMKEWNGQISRAVEAHMFGIQGASVLVRRQLLNTVGLLSEDYFLYFEEQDWAVRARERFTLAYAPGSVVYHKEGAVVSPDRRRSGDKSRTSDYYYIKNKLTFTRKFFPFALPTVYAGLLISMGLRMWRGQWDRVWMILRIAFGDA